MNTDFDFSNNQTYMVEIEYNHPQLGQSWDLCEISNESDLQEFNELIGLYQDTGAYVGFEIL